MYLGGIEKVETNHLFPFVQFSHVDFFPIFFLTMGFVL
jgi:hypothetical protein